MGGWDDGTVAPNVRACRYINDGMVTQASRDRWID
jgi:hypothetical protein